jgi:hypothetical protein
MIMSLFITWKRNTARVTKIWDMNWLTLPSNIYISVRKFLIGLLVFMVAGKRTLSQVGCFWKGELFYLTVASVTRLHSVDGAWIKYEHGMLVERKWQRKPRVEGEKYVHVSPSQQIPCKLLWDGTRTSAMRGQRLIAWTMLVVMFFRYVELAIQKADSLTFWRRNYFFFNFSTPCI